MAVTTVTYGPTGGVQTFTVPANVTQITVDLRGGKGGNSGYGAAANPGRVAGTLNVVAGQVYYIYVGGNGKDGIYSSGYGGAGGWNGGNAGGIGGASPGTYPAFGGGGGGGASDIRGPNSQAVSARKCVAGGSGGDSGFTPKGVNGAGGAATGGTGSGGTVSGKGGTQSAGGAGGVHDPSGGVSGGAGNTSGGGGSAGTAGNGYVAGSGGGGGYRGGGGGAGGNWTTYDGTTTYYPAGGGGGGSNYVGGLASTTANSQGYAVSSGSVIITYPANATSPPNTPTNVVPADGTATRSTGSVTTSATVSDPNSNNCYMLFRYSTDPNFGSYTDAVGSTVASGSTSTEVITGLAVNTHYYARVYTYNPTVGKYSDNYVSVSFYTNRPPNTPTSVLPTSGSPTLTLSTAAIQGVVTDPDGGNVQLLVWASTDPNFATHTTTYGTVVTSSGTSAVALNGLTANTHYYARVYGYDTVTGSTGYASTDFWTDRPPNAPLLISPAVGANVDFTQAATFTWSFSDPDAGDTQTQADVQYRIVGSGTWIVVSAAATSVQTWTAAANTFSGGNYEWQVRTYDIAGTVGPWSPSGTFTTASAPAAPTGIAPTGTITTLPITFTWSSTGAETGYQYQLQSDLSGAPDPNGIFYQSGTIVDSSKSAVVTAYLPSQKQWISIRYYTYDGIWSSWTSSYYTIQIPAPEAGFITATPNNDAGTITLDMSFPTYGVQTAQLTLSRDAQDGSDPIQLYSGIPITSYIDRFPAANVLYAYTMEQVASYGSSIRENLLTENEGHLTQDASDWSLDPVLYGTLGVLSNTTVGTYCQVNATTSGGAGYQGYVPIFLTRLLPVTPGKLYSLTLWVYMVSNANSPKYTFHWLDSVGGEISAPQRSVTISNLSMWLEVLPFIREPAPLGAVSLQVEYQPYTVGSQDQAFTLVSVVEAG